MGFGIDPHHLGVDPNVEAESFEQSLGSLEEQIVLVLDHPANEVRKTAVGIGHVARALDNDDLRLLVEPTKAGSRRHPTRYTSDHQHPQGMRRSGTAGSSVVGRVRLGVR